MQYPEIASRLGTYLRAAPAPGDTRLPHVGAVTCVLGHRLRSVRLPQSICVLVLSGHKTLFLGEDRLTVREGDMFLLPAQMEVTIENNPDPARGRYLALCLPLESGVVARVSAAAGSGEPAGSLGLGSLRVDVDAPLAGSLSHLLDMAAACPGNERLLGLCMEAFLLLVSERTAGFAALWRAESSWRTKCARLVSLDPARDWSGQDVAGRLGVSERTLRRNLSREDASLRQVLRDVRLNSALALLQTGRSNVAEVAAGCGYESPSRFAVLFRERFGVRPSDIARFMAGTEQDMAGTERTGRRLAG